MAMRVVSATSVFGGEIVAGNGVDRRTDAALVAHEFFGFETPHGIVECLGVIALAEVADGEQALAVGLRLAVCAVWQGLEGIVAGTLVVLPVKVILACPVPHQFVDAVGVALGIEGDGMVGKLVRIESLEDLVGYLGLVARRLVAFYPSLYLCFVARKSRA